MINSYIFATNYDKRHVFNMIKHSSDIKISMMACMMCMCTGIFEREGENI